MRFYLVEGSENGKARWALDVESLHRAVSKKTRLIVVTNPNNPTGAVLNQEEMDEDCAGRAQGPCLAPGG